MTNRQSSGHTRQRLLEAACRLFAERGYRGATVQAICRAARANVAAVNYHFGGKKNLYRRAWQHAHARVLELAPPEGGVAPNSSAQQRLRGQIRAGVRRALLGDAVAFRIMRQEMIHPTGLLQQVIRDAIAPMRRAMQAVLRQLLGPRASDRQVELCEICVIAPLMHLLHRRQAGRHEGLAGVVREDMLEQIADQFAAFALAGLREVRRRIEAGGDPRRCRNREPQETVSEP
jgi:AcrR family transcriptional regulator